MADEIKRVNYFAGQLLGADDFAAEQAYHLSMRRHEHRLARSHGVVEGLELSGTPGGKEITVSPGYAVDALGREIILLPPTGGAPLPSLAIPAGLTGLVSVVIRYDEALTDLSPGGPTRVSEQPKIDFQPGRVTNSQLVLGRVKLDATSSILELDTHLRRLSELRLPAGGTLRGNGHVRIAGEESLHLLNRSGVIVGRELGGNGDLTVQGSLRVDGDVRWAGDHAGDLRYLRLGAVQIAWGRGTLLVTANQPVVAESIAFAASFAAQGLPAVTISLEPPGNHPDLSPDQFRGAFVASNVTRAGFSVTYSTVNPLLGGYEASYSWMAIGAWTPSI